MSRQRRKTGEVLTIKVDNQRPLKSRHGKGGVRLSMSLSSIEMLSPKIIMRFWRGVEKSLGRKIEETEPV